MPPSILANATRFSVHHETHIRTCCVQEERMRQDQLRLRTEGAMLLQMENELKESKGEIERSQIIFPV
jgi:hypothetical protein